MHRLRSAALATLALGVMLTGCADSSSKDIVSNLNDLKYTGNSRSDAKSLCHVTKTLNHLNNSEREIVQNAVLDATKQFSKSDDVKVNKIIDGMKMATSADQKVRAKGNEALGNLCQKI